MELVKQSVLIMMVWGEGCWGYGQIGLDMGCGERAVGTGEQVCLDMGVWEGCWNYGHICLDIGVWGGLLELWTDRS